MSSPDRSGRFRRAFDTVFHHSRREKKGALSSSGGISRRAAIGLIIGVPAAVVLGDGAVQLTRNAIAWQEQKDRWAKLSPGEKLHERGLADFLDYYTAVQDMKNAYGIYAGQPPYDQSIIDPEPYNVLEDVVNNLDYDKAAVGVLQEGWGTLREQDATEQAVQKANRMTITWDPGLPMTVEKGREIVGRLAMLQPASIMMAPDTFHFQYDTGIDGGFYAEAQTTDPNTQQWISPEISLDAPSVAGIEFTMGAALHELAHAEVAWENAKQYTRSRKKFAEYRAAETIQTKRILDSYFSMPWEQAHEMFQNRGISGYFPTNDNPQQYLDITGNTTDEYTANYLQQVVSIEGQCKSAYGITFGGQDDSQDPAYRYNRLIHAVGSKRVALLKKGNLTSQERNFMHDSEYGDGTPAMLLNLAVMDVYHFLRTPLEDTHGDIAGRKNLPPDPTGVVTQAMEQTMLARLRAFSTLSDRELQSPIAAAQAVRNHLGLDTPPIPVS